jgi:hypothetical protein
MIGEMPYLGESELWQVRGSRRSESGEWLLNSEDVPSVANGKAHMNGAYHPALKINVLC